jgi:hypothetical protein
VAEPNVAELVAIYQHIKAHPEEWNQFYYGCRTDCGTAYCVAGWAAARAGYEMDWPDDVYLKRIATHVTAGPLVDEVAQRILGLTDEQADDLFQEENDLDDIRAIITEITGVDPEATS